MMYSFKYLLRLQNYVFGNQQAANSSCPSQPFKWCLGISDDEEDDSSFCIQNPTLIPTCLLALLIGVVCSKRITRLPGKFPSRWFYHLTFFLYGIMMTSAGILHCFLGDQQTSVNVFDNTDNGFFQFFRLFISVIDVGLTTSIAITILFCGLSDIRFFNSQSMTTRSFLFLLYLLVFVLWTLGIINEWQWIFDVLYLGVISICCFVYLLTQLCIKSARRALPVLLVGGLYGAFGLLATSYAAESVCRSEGPFWSQFIGPEFIWFLFSDISMAFVYLYVTRANQASVVKNYPIELKEQPEKF